GGGRGHSAGPRAGDRRERQHGGRSDGAREGLGGLARGEPGRGRRGGGAVVRGRGRGGAADDLGPRGPARGDRRAGGRREHHAVRRRGHSGERGGGGRVRTARGGAAERRAGLRRAVDAHARAVAGGDRGRRGALLHGGHWHRDRPAIPRGGGVALGRPVLPGGDGRGDGGGLRVAAVAAAQPVRDHVREHGRRGRAGTLDRGERAVRRGHGDRPARVHQPPGGRTSAGRHGGRARLDTGGGAARGGGDAGGEVLGIAAATARAGGARD